MSKTAQLYFPELVLFVDHGGDFQAYFNAVYEIFETDFIRSKPTFNGQQVSAQKHPLVDGEIHRTFYHITHEGKIEDERTPDIRRMERIRFPRFLIDSSPHEELLIWENTRGRDVRTLIFNPNEKYLVVLTKRRGFYLFWTAYIVVRQHRIDKLMKEYEKYKKTKTA